MSNNKSFTDQDDFVNFVQSATRKESNGGKKLSVKIYHDVTAPPVWCAFYFPPEQHSKNSVSLESMAAVIRENEELKAQLLLAKQNK